MAFSLSFSLFIFIIVFYIVIVKLFTILFRITGLTEEVARFQVISLITNSGYTTNESELIVSVLSRRKLARFMMLFGYAFSISVISVFCNMVLSLPLSEKEEVWPVIIVVSTLFLIFIIVWRIPIVRTAIDSVMERAGRKIIYGDKENVVLVQEQYLTGVMAAVTLNVLPEDLAGKSLSELRLPQEYSIYVVFINRDGDLQLKIDGQTSLQQGDVATVFGPAKEIHKVFADTTYKQSHLAMAPKPETEQQFIHEEDLRKAKQAAEALRASHKPANSADNSASARKRDEAHNQDASISGEEKK